MSKFSIFLFLNFYFCVSLHLTLLEIRTVKQRIDEGKCSKSIVPQCTLLSNFAAGNEGAGIATRLAIEN